MLGASASTREAPSQPSSRTYRLWWGVERGSAVMWISEAQFVGLPRRTRAALVREQVKRRRGAVPTARAWVDALDGRLPSRHREVDDDVWRLSAEVLPNARGLAGTFPSGSTTNCFGSVMCAAGADGAAAYDDVRPFEAWLASVCVRGGDETQPGVVLLWRSHDGAPVHAAVTIGGGWGLEKPSKDWHSPFAVARVTDIKRMSRHPGERLERHTLR